MILVICAHTTLTHFSVPCFDKFFKHFKRFCGLNISRKQITNFWSTRSKTFCAKFIIIWSSTMRLFWCCARFDLMVSDFLKTFFIYLGFRLFFVLYISAQRYLSLWTVIAAFRSSRLDVFCTKCVLINYAKFTGKHLCQSLFLNKVQAPPATLLKKRLWYRCFPVNFAKFVETTFLQDTSGPLHLSTFW